MRANPVERCDLSTHIADGVRRVPDHHFHYRVRPNLGSRRNFDECHSYSKPKRARDVKIKRIASSLCRH